LLYLFDNALTGLLKEIKMSTTTNREQSMYGCVADEFLAQIKDSSTYRLCGANMIVAGLMSDAQEEMAMGNAEAARLTLNRAKLVLFQVMEGNLKAGR
jgi:hypothetical protein